MSDKIRIHGDITEIKVISESKCELTIENRVYIIPAIVLGGQAVVNVFRKLFKEGDYIEASGKVAGGLNSEGNKVFAINVVHLHKRCGTMVDTYA
jgi:hypothetical protein